MEYSSLSDYDYHLPPELIAQEPLAERDASRMLVLDRQAEKIEHSIFKRLPDYLQKGDLLVLNNTRVIPARFYGLIAGKTTAAEILLLHKLPDGDWVAMTKPGRKLKPGITVQLDFGVEAFIAGYADKGLRIVRFSAPEPFEQILPRLGKVPLPPYIKKEVELEKGKKDKVIVTLIPEHEFKESDLENLAYELNIQLISSFVEEEESRKHIGIRDTMMKAALLPQTQGPLQSEKRSES